MYINDQRMHYNSCPARGPYSCDIPHVCEEKPRVLHFELRLNHRLIRSAEILQLLLLHRPALIRFLRGEKNLETCAAREKCIASANTALSIFCDLVEDPQFIPHMWWTSGLGSFSHPNGTCAVSIEDMALQMKYNEPLCLVLLC